MRYMKYLWIVLLLQCVLANAGLAETLMQDGVVVSYELGAEEPGKFSIEIQNDNRYAVEVILNIYAMLTRKAVDAVLCNEDFLKTYELQAGRILRTIEPGCEPKRLRKLEAYVKIIGVKQIQEALKPTPATTPEPVEAPEETPAPIVEPSPTSVVEEAERTPEPVEIAEETPVQAAPVVEISPTPVVEEQEIPSQEAAPQKEEPSPDTSPVLKEPTVEPAVVSQQEPPDPMPVQPKKIPDPLVEEIQRTLQQLEYNPGPIDGLMGRKTATAISAFQEEHNIPVDGLPSAELLAILSEYQDQQMEQRQETPLSQEKLPDAGLSGKELVIGVLFDGPQPTPFFELLYQELVRLFGDEYHLSVPEQKMLGGDWTREQAARNLDQLLADPEVDMVVALDIIASHEAAHRKDLSKPVFAPLILDEDLQQLPIKELESGVHNLNYLISLPKIETGMEMFRRMADFRHGAILMSRYYYDAIPEIQEYVQARKGALEKEGISMTPILVGESVDEALTQITPDIEAAYLIPVLHFSDAENQQLFAALNEKQLLTFSHLGLSDVEEGVLAAIAPKNDFQRLARRIALNMQRTLEGEDPGTFAVYFRKDGEEQLVINMATARQIGFSPTFATLVEATLLNEEPESTVRQLTLPAAIDEAIEANLTLLSKQQEVIAGEENIRIANAARLPQIDLSAGGSMIDADRASGLIFGGSEQVLSGSAGLRQLIYSDTANANVSIQKSLQQSRENDLETVTLDIVLFAARGYLDVLRAKTLLNIQQENLNLTEFNLDVARTRVSVGIAGKGEIYRWETALANDRQDVLDAQNAHQQARYNLNRLLNRPQEEAFITGETEMTEPFLLDKAPLLQYLNNQQRFELFRDFAVELGLANAPELAQTDALIAAQTRKISALFREYVVPSFGFQGDVTGIFAKGGEGADGLDTSGFPPEVGNAFSSPDDTAWFVGIGLSWPLFSGGGKRSEHRQAKLELERLLTDKAVIAQNLEQRIRSSVYQTGNSYVQIRFAQDGADAAQQTLNLVTISYTEGLASILEMLDAQNAKLIADELVANSIYNFLLDLVDSQRATNTFDFLMSLEEREQYDLKLEEFFRQQGMNISQNNS